MITHHLKIRSSSRSPHQGTGKRRKLWQDGICALSGLAQGPFFLAGGDSEDLIQEGTFGLLSAIRQYRADAGASFKTFAEHCIRMRLLSAIKSASQLKHFPLNDGVSLEQLSEDPGAQLSAIPEISRRSPGRACSGEREQGRTLRGLFQMPFTV